LNDDKAVVKAKLDIVIEYLNSATDILYNIEGTVPNENYELLEGIISDLDSFKRFL
jgi:GH43 family beta-xylosidase